MSDVNVLISKRKRNFLVIALLMSLAANLFVLGAGISYAKRHQPRAVSQNPGGLEKIEQRFLKRVAEADRPAVREILRENRETSGKLISYYRTERDELLAYIDEGDIQPDELARLSGDMLEREHVLSRHLNSVLQQTISVSGQETRANIAEMIRLRNTRHHRPGKKWMAPGKPPKKDN